MWQERVLMRCFFPILCLFNNLHHPNVAGKSSYEMFLFHTLTFKIIYMWVEFIPELQWKSVIVWEKSKLSIERPMERRVYEAALEGNVISLLELLQEDALILDRAVLSMETPLHVAVMLGHVSFAKEILNRKPELAGEFDFQRCSPLHLASAKGHAEIVKLLLSINPGVCFARDRDGRTPLHLAVIKDRVEVLNEFVRAKPETCWVRIDRGGTILHLCIKHNSFEALKLLVRSVNDDEFVNLKDDDGNSILHLAVINKQLEILKFLLDNTQIKVNELNSYGLTALDVLSQSLRDLKDMDILESLQKAGAVKAKDGGLRKNMTSDQISHELSHSEESSAENDPKNKGDWIREKRNALMVVASLIAAMAFQAGVNPPGGLWQDDKLDSEGNYVYIAGSSIMATHHSYYYHKFLVSNTVGFLASFSIVLLLISGLPMKHRFFVWGLMVILWVAITSMTYCYLISIATSTPLVLNQLITADYIFSDAVFSWIGLMGLLLLGHTIRLAVMSFRKSGFFRRMIELFDSKLKRNRINV